MHRTTLFSFFALGLAGFSVAAETPAASSNDLLSIMPESRMNRALRPVTENPFRRFVVQIHDDDRGDGSSVESLVEKNFGGHNIGGVVPASQHFKGGAVIGGVLFELGEEILVEKDGEAIQVVKGYRIFLRQITSKAIVLELNQVGVGAEPGDSKKTSDNKQSVSLPLDEFFK